MPDLACHRYDSGGGAAAPVSTLTSGASGGGGRNERRVTLAMIKEEGLGAGGNTAAYVQARTLHEPRGMLLSCAGLGAPGRP